ncbi:MAG: iron ABC transporter permease [Gammaproteobacteria bacterium]|nr:iron ABC transporter permease [Gammaproteobacteria bacterium]
MLSGPARALLLPGLVILLIAAVPLSLSVGMIQIDWPRIGDDDTASIALLQLRLPRVLLAVLIGAVMAQTGAVAQALFRNPLAEPGLIGVSAGAALAAALVHTALVGASAVAVLPPSLLLPIAAFAGGLAAAFVVLRLARRDGQTDMTTMLLAGTAINAFVAAIVGLLSARADDAGLRGFTLWMYGNLGRAGWNEIAVAAPLLLAVGLWLPREARGLDALLLGDAEAQHLGIDVERLKRRLLIAVVLATGAAVSLAGVIGFVGLVVPHAIRLLAGPGHRLLMPASALLGAILLTLADTVARTAAAPAEWPVGALTSALGAPFFLALLLRMRTRIGLP